MTYTEKQRDKAEEAAQAAKEALYGQIETQYDPKPIPLRQFDWSACMEGYDVGDAVGYGETESAAINDLLGQVGP